MAIDIGPPEQSDQQTSPRCDPDDIALKSFFLGPQSENADWFADVFRGVLTAYFSWRRRMYSRDGRAISKDDQKTPEFRKQRREVVRQMQQLMERFEDEVPKFSPRYIGHMFSETSMPAMIGHIITLFHNPNNISGESSRVGIELEHEAIDALAGMLGFDSERVRGHFTSGGTVANFEGMVRARHRLRRFLCVGAQARASEETELSLFEAAHMGWEDFDKFHKKLGKNAEPTRFDPGRANPFEVANRLQSTFDTPYRGPVVLVPEHKHYSWVKGIELLGMGKEAFWPVELDEEGVLSVDHLQERIEEARRKARPILMVVSVAGTTELGIFDPVHDVQDLLDAYQTEEGLDIYHHVDAAYGGFFAADVCGRARCVMGDGACQSLEAIRRANSTTLDPHKLGYVPYSSGTFICAEPREYFAGDIDAPYVDFDDELDPGPQTIEGSRSAAGAVATWLTATSIGLDSDGYGRILRRTIQARTRLKQALEATDLPVRIAPGDSNILTFCVAPDEEPISKTNRRAQRLYDAFSPEQNGEFFVSKTALRFSDYDSLLTSFVDSWNGTIDEDELTLVRLCVMNPFLDSRETDTNFPREFARAVEDHVDLD